MSADVELDHLWIRFGDFTAVADANLRIEAGEFFSFLGPSGCGKTTILRAISGFLDPTEGEVRIGGKNMWGIGPNKRPTALIFQNLALFPLMSVADNIAFGLEVRGVKKFERRKRAEELLNLIALHGQGDKLVSALSGGQRQRVAIDQGEALTMSDRVAVMSNGVIQQIGDGATIYNHPATAFVASFVGENNPFFGRVLRADGDYAQIDSKFGPLRGRNEQGLREGDQAILFVRPESLSLTNGVVAENVIESTVRTEEFEGQFMKIYLAGEGPKHIALSVTNDGSIPRPEQGSTARIAFDASRAVVLPRGEMAGE